MATSIEEVARAILCKELDLPPEEVTAERDIRELPGVQSIKILRAVTRIEAHYDIELDDEAVFEVKSLAELAALIEPKLARGAAASEPL
jgi:acyl carrier protein